MSDGSETAGNSRAVQSNQTGLHERLDEVVLKHLAEPFLKPQAERSLALFAQLSEQVKQHGGPVVLDSCCGVGESTRRLALRHPQALVIGMDKSADRIERQSDLAISADNYLLARADLNDLWRLIAAADWPITHHYLLYPNPWPKSKHLQRRWHGAGVFPDLIKIGGQLELRSNWPIYLQEFARALALAGQGQHPVVPLTDATEALTPFERKYRDSGQALWQLVCELG
ncbi:SAM-dependent methyltransferase [Corallincola holothuriorum]|uniref:tRNA (guanine(46)-N(7))-methyltransferase n=1 Tax=Corallincola holothuriorum TaxID=2282215 RepID=A0A368NLY0_9GAMM|nr:SAM-dependent methyltransferase [Corallincola holothuriorum]RCU51602.1 SAM-dependent methyltransferase [Corallincola holothuriorum]